MPHFVRVALLLALPASCVQGMRRGATSENILSESAVRNDGESEVSDERKIVATNSTSVLGLYDTSMLGQAESAKMPEYAKKGICCQWDDRFGRTIFRWFYHMTKSSLGKESYSKPWSCPGTVPGTSYLPGVRGKWLKADGFDCVNMGAYNKVGYKEDSDWVMCCNVGEKVDYFYAGGEPCKAYGGGSSLNPATRGRCTNKECYEHDNVDANAVTCPTTHATKLVNEKADWACSKEKRGDGIRRPAQYQNFTDMQCAGYDKNCAVINCIKHSITRSNKRDCSDWCSPQFAMGAAAYSGATQTAVYSFWLLLSIVAGAVSPALA